MRLLLINPNTNAATTDMMAGIARQVLADRSLSSLGGEAPSLEAMTVSAGVPLITDPAALAKAADAVVSALASVPRADYDGFIIAAFGDPGLIRARALGHTPVTGIAEAAMAEAPGRFAVVTTTPLLVDSIADTAALYGHQQRFTGVHLTPGDPGALMGSPDALLKAMLDACRRAIAADHPDSIVIGGGPLARVARVLRPLLPIPVIEPIPAAVRLAITRAAPHRSRPNPTLGVTP